MHAATQFEPGTRPDAAAAYRQRRTPRQMEAEVFVRANRSIREAMAEKSETALARARADNRRLWDVVLSLVMDPANQLPAPLRSQPDPACLAASPSTLPLSPLLQPLPCWAYTLPWMLLPAATLSLGWSPGTCSSPYSLTQTMHVRLPHPPPCPSPLSSSHSPAGRTPYPCCCCLLPHCHWARAQGPAPPPTLSASPCLFGCLTLHPAPLHIKKLFTAP